MGWRLPPETDVWKQTALILALSAGMGLAYNAASPVGIRWSEPPPPHAESPSPAPPPAAAAAPMAQPQTAPGAAPAPATNPPPAAFVPSLVAQYVPPSPTTWPEVKPLHAQKKIVLVDARSRGAYDAGHIPGAVLLSEPPMPDDFAAFLRDHPTNTHVVVYCSSTSCSLSFRLAHRLAREGGYGLVQYMTGGYLDWQRDQVLTQGGGAAPPSSTSAVARVVAPREIPAQDQAPLTPPIAAAPPGVKLDHALPILWSQAKPLAGIGQVVLLDARPKADFDAGHVPGALWLPADASAETVRQLLGDRPRTTRLVAYCNAMGCPEAFQLATRLVREFDFPNAQFMLEGFAEWRRAEQPTAPPASR